MPVVKQEHSEQAESKSQVAAKPLIAVKPLPKYAVEKYNNRILVTPTPEIIGPYDYHMLVIGS